MSTVSAVPGRSVNTVSAVPGRSVNTVSAVPAPRTASRRSVVWPSVASVPTEKQRQFLIKLYKQQTSVGVPDPHVFGLRIH